MSQELVLLFCYCYSFNAVLLRPNVCLLIAEI